MAAADLTVVITGVILHRIIGIYFPGSYLSLTLVCRIKTPIVYASRDASVWLTVAFTFDRFVAICCQNLKNKYCTKRKAASIVGVVIALSFVKNTPWYFFYEPLYTSQNLPWYCRGKASFHNSPLWQAFTDLDCTISPLLPFFIMLLLNVLTVRHIMVTSRVRKVLRAKACTENAPDLEMENRRKSIILLFSISGNFILLWLTYTINYTYYRISRTYYYSGYNDPLFILQESGYMLLLLSCCTNTFIYAVTQSKFREELKMMLIFPIYQILKCVCKTSG
ncbi:probable G-protein coupled receptor 139 [Narcine bancroftii]|uniref:probable G-protein coupled receptor 139 n=1 Tax=Narcine bancroftii TaxID=1343680 RepID=UPI00383152AE